MAGEDLRSEAERALAEGSSASVKQAAAVMVGMATLLSFAGAGMHALEQFTLEWLVCFGVVAMLSGPSAWLVLELFRLHRHSRLLREVLNSEKHYENLIELLRDERDQLQTRAIALESQLELRLHALAELRAAQRRDSGGDES